MDQTPLEPSAVQALKHHRRNIVLLVVLLAVSLGLLAWAVSQHNNAPSASVVSNAPSAVVVSPTPIAASLPPKVTKNVVIVTFGFADTDFSALDPAVDRESLLDGQASVKNYYA